MICLVCCMELCQNAQPSADLLIPIKDNLLPMITTSQDIQGLPDAGCCCCCRCTSTMNSPGGKSPKSHGMVLSPTHMSNRYRFPTGKACLRAFDKACFEVISLRGMLYFSSQPVTRTIRPSMIEVGGQNVCCKSSIQEQWQLLLVSHDAQLKTGDLLNKPGGGVDLVRAVKATAILLRPEAPSSTTSIYNMVNWA